MSETEKTNIALPFMSETDIAALSVSALSDRPNEHSGQYGRKGLTPAELKAAFSALPVAIAGRLNELLPQIIKRFEETETSCGESNEALRVAIMEAVAGLDDALKSELLVAISGKLDRRSGSGLYRTVYAEGTDGNTEMIRVSSTPTVGGIVSYGEDGHFGVAAPLSPSHPVTKNYFDTKKNNSLYTEVTDAVRRVQALEHSANGNIYGNVCLSGSGSVLQVDNACPYGILSKIGGRVTKITVGLAFNTAGTLAHTSGVSVTENISSNSVSIPVGEKYNIKIPCDFSAPCTVTVYAVERGTGYLNKGGLMNASKAQIGSQVSFRNGVSELSLADGSADAKYICVTKQDQGTELTEPCYLDELRVTVSDPAKAKILRVIEEIDIPNDILSLDGYGEEGAYLDVIAGKYFFADGASVSVTLPAEFEVISLLPSALVEFTDEDGNRVAADYELTYKNKL